jgi:hypothetical protein
MARALIGLVVVVGMAVPAFPKVLCPPGSFVIQTTGGSAMDGTVLELGRGRARLGDTCATVRARRFHRASGSWLSVVRARWRRCDGRPVALRAQWDFEAPYCTRLTGAVRTGGGRRTEFVADRVPACGNGIREGAELCDGQAGTFFAADCCTDDCRLKPDCPRLCDVWFACEPDEICGHICGFGGVCLERATTDCDGGPVCGCDGTTTYADRCVAYDAGTGVSSPGPCVGG